MNKNIPKAILLISCPDQRGITAAVTGFIAQNHGNILHADQHIDDHTNTLFMRVVWTLDQCAKEFSQLRADFEPLANDFNMTWQMTHSAQRIRMAVFVSKHLHCLYDLIYRFQSGQLMCEWPLVISNHADARSLCEANGIAYHHIEITPETKHQQEIREIDLLKEHRIDLIVLARYHQILTADFIKHYPNKIINIHHSFLPAFAGARPYDQAHQKGVKLIGATSHYVTEELDAGPIIEQDTGRVSHRDSVVDLIRLGEDLERTVLSRALRWHLEGKILCFENKTVVFD